MVAVNFSTKGWCSYSKRHLTTDDMCQQNGKYICLYIHDACTQICGLVVENRSRSCKDCTLCWALAPIVETELAKIRKARLQIRLCHYDPDLDPRALEAYTFIYLFIYIYILSLYIYTLHAPVLYRLWN